MARIRRSGEQVSASIWPGFVDAMTALLLVLMFVLTIFMIVQFFLRETISDQDTQLNYLSQQVASLAEALGLEQQKSDGLETEVKRLDSELVDERSQAEIQSALIATLSQQAKNQAATIADFETQVTSFEAQVASLLAERSQLQLDKTGLEDELAAGAKENATLVARISEAEAENLRIVSEKEALSLALASARDEIDQGVEAARLAAAKREALEALIAETQTTLATRETSLAAALASLDDTRRNLGTSETNLSDLEAQLAKMAADLADSQAATQAELASNAELQARLDVLEEGLSTSQKERLAVEAAVAKLRAELEASQNDLSTEEQARLAEQAAALALQKRLKDTEAALSEEEKTRLVEAAAAEALRKKLESANAELTAMTLALEKQRQEAEDTLTLLAAADVAKGELDSLLQAALLAQDNAAKANADATAEIAAIKSDRDRLLDLIAALEAEKTSLTGRLVEIEGEKADLDARLASVIAQLEDTGDARDTALANAASTREALEKRLAEALAAKAAAERAADVSKAQLEAKLAAALAAKLEAEKVATSGSDALKAQLAAALAAKLAAEKDTSAIVSKAEQRRILLAQANEKLKTEVARSAKAEREIALLNQQTATLRKQLNALQALLDDAEEKDRAAQVEIQSLGANLNTALARVAAEQRKRADLEAAERKRLEEETKNLEKFKSEFFGRMRDLLANREGVRIDGDRFVFASEVLFPAGSATLSHEGEAEIAKVARLILDVADKIPDDIDWILRVDGHTDNVPLRGTGEFKDNWELSQARALSVVRYMIDDLGVPPNRLAANGFGEFQPVNTANTREARAQNRRIELKFTER
jgi:chemotaxis protein MotB